MLTAEEIDIIIAKMEERQAFNKVKGVKSPETEFVRGSIVSPVTPKPEQKDLKEFKDQIRDEIADGLSSIENKITNEITQETGGSTGNNYYYGGIKLHSAVAAEDAPSDSTIITCYLDGDVGNEVEVHCIVEAATVLSECVPELKEDDSTIIVAQIDGEWWCVSDIFTGYVECAES